VARQAVCAGVLALGLIAGLAACAPRNTPTTPSYQAAAPDLALPSRRAGSALRHRAQQRQTAARSHRRPEPRHALAEWTNPPLGAGE
jgi:hypothetical protein